MPVRAATETAQPQNTFNFTDVTVSTGSSATESNQKTAIKTRKSPVSASGSYQTSIPIAVPPGRLGMTPSLALSYDSGNFRRQAFTGAGWSFAPPSISYSTSKGHPPLKRLTNGALVYDSDKATFVGPAGEMLLWQGPSIQVPTSITGSQIFYAPVREMTPVRFEFDPTGNYWVEHATNGVKRYYGKIDTTFGATVVNELGTFAWHLAREVDVNGNTVEYTYFTEASGENRADKTTLQDAPMLQKVEWGGNRNGGTAHIFSLVVSRTKVTNAPTDYLNGHVQYANRILDVKVCGPQGPAPTYEPTFSYGLSGDTACAGKLVYWKYSLTQEKSAETSREWLVNVTQTAYGTGAQSRSWTFSYQNNLKSGAVQPIKFDPTSKELPPYAYSQMERGGSEHLTMQDLVTPPNTRAGTRFLDINGDGLTDMVYHPAGLASPASTFLQDYALPGVGVTMTKSWLQNGLVSGGEANKWTTNDYSTQGFFAESATQVYEVPPVYSDLSDIDGDGLADAIFYHTDIGTDFLPPRRDEPCYSNSFYEQCGAFGVSGFISTCQADPSCKAKLDLYAHVDFTMCDSSYCNMTEQSVVSLFAEWDPAGWQTYTPLSSQGLPIIQAHDCIPKMETDLVAVPLALVLQKLGINPSNPPEVPTIPKESLSGAALTELCMALLAGCAGKHFSEGIPSFRVNGSFDPYSELYSGPGQVTQPQVQPTSYRVSGDYNRAAAQPEHIPTALLPGWPDGVVKHAVRAVVAPKERPWDDPSEYQILAQRDFNAPIVDVNADGKADIVLLKVQDREIGTGLAPRFQFMPRAYLGQGNAQWKLDEHEYLAQYASQWSANPEAISDFTKSLRDLLVRPGTRFSYGWETPEGATYEYGPSYNAFFMDLNGDSLPDLIAANPPGLPPGSTPWGCDGYRRYGNEGHSVYLNRGYRFAAPNLASAAGWAAAGTPLAFFLKRTVEYKCVIDDPEKIVDTNNAFIHAPMQLGAFTDLNADGRPDVAIIVGWIADPNRPVKSESYVNVGDKFVAQASLLDDLRALPAQDSAGPRLGLAAATSLHSNQQYYNYVLPDEGRFADMDGDGLQDFVVPGAYYVKKPTESCDAGYKQEPNTNVCYKQAFWYRNLNTVPDLLTKEVHSGGAETEVAYVAAGSRDAKLAGIVDSKLAPAGLMVVSEVRRRAGPASASCTGSEQLCYDQEVIRFTYKDYVKDAQANENVGFKTVTASFYNAQNGIQSTEPLTISQEFYQTAYMGTLVPYPLRGVVKATTVTSPDGWKSVQTDSYSVAAYATRQDVARIRLSSSLSEDSLGTKLARKLTTYSDLDDYGYASEVLEGDAPTGTIDTYARKRTKRTFKSLLGSTWVMGLVLEEAVFGTSYDISGNRTTDALMRRSVAKFDSVGRPLEMRRVGIGASECVARGHDADDANQYALYDSWGHPTEFRAHNGRARFVLRYDSNQLYRSNGSVTVSNYLDGVIKSTITLSSDAQYDPRNGNVVVSIDTNGQRTESSLDPFGRVLREYDALGRRKSESTYVDTYPARVTDLLATTSSNSAITTAVQRETYLDGEGRVVEVYEQSYGPNDPAGRARVKALKRDAFGNEAYTYLPEFVPLSGSAPRIEKAFDVLGRERSVRTPDGTAAGRLTTYRYEPRLTIMVNPRGNALAVPSETTFSTHTQVDWQGQTTRITTYGTATEGDATTTILRDSMGQPVQLVDPDGAIREVQFDNAGRMYRFTLGHDRSVRGNLMTQCWDADDTMTYQRNPVGEEVTLSVDELGRPYRRTVSSPLGTEIQTLSYDSSSASYGKGRRTRATNGAGTWSYNYDPRGFINSVTLVGSSNWTTPTVTRSQFDASLTYDVQGRLTAARIETPSGTPPPLSLGDYRYEYNDRGQLKRVYNNDNPTAPGFADGFTYDAANHMTSAAFASGGLTATWTYHAQTQELATIDYVANRVSLIKLDYKNRDKNGNILDELRDGYFPGAGGTRNLISKTYKYDGRDRLIQSPDGSTIDNFTYTLGGDILNGSTTGSSQWESYEYNDPTLAHAVTRIEPAKPENPLGQFTPRDLYYDAAGRVDQSVVGVSTTNYTWDASNCLREISRTTSSTKHWCDVDGSRVLRRSVNSIGTLTRMIPFLELGEIKPDDSGGVFTWRMPVNGTVAIEESVSLTDGSMVGGVKSGFVMSDIRGSVVAETDMQAVPQSVEAVDYDGWGVIRKVGAAVPDHAYVGEERDPVFGYYTYGVRVYDPALKRWLSPEPEWLTQGPIGLNAYQYANLNPIGNTDRSGRAAETVWDALNVVYDVAKIAYGSYTNNQQLVEEGEQDLVLDAGAMVVPGVPAGTSKILRFTAKHGDEVKSVVSKSDEIVDATRTADKTADASKAFKEATERGRKSESRVLADKGMAKNKEKVSTSEGNAVPDGMDSKQIVEVKDTKKVTATKQVRVETQAAKDSGRESVLVTGTNTEVSNTAQRLFDKIERRDDLGPRR
ncbi:MAG: SpvB/TcaC N-terminal domain-containing protein [Myxococcota bacterium]